MLRLNPSLVEVSPSFKINADSRHSSVADQLSCLKFTLPALLLVYY